MRTMMKAIIPTEAGNTAIKDGTLPRVMSTFMETWKPEAAYFTTHGGERTMYAVIDLKDNTLIPVIAEPFFMNLKAKVEFMPVMNAADLKAGLSKINNH